MRKNTKRPGGAVRAMRFITVLLALACIGLGLYVLLTRYVLPAAEPLPGTIGFAGSTTFAPGVSVEGVELAGKTFDEAASLLHARERALPVDAQFVLRARESSLTVTPSDMKISYNTAEVLEEAIALGNTGTRQEQKQAREDLLAAPRDFKLAYAIDVSPVRVKLAALAKEVYTAPVDAAVQMDMSVPGFFVYTEGIPGEELQEDELIAELQRRADERAFGEVELPIAYTQPAISVEALKTSLVLRGAAETSFKKSPYNREDRVYNVKRAASLVNGFVLKPDQVFSTNDTLGPRTYELGWKPAPAYVRGATEDQAGGGVCQISSTLYNAVVKADLEIVFRRNHSSHVAYVPYGLDATINTGTIDFQFKNNTKSDIYIFAYTIDSKDEKVPEGKTDKTVHIEIFGESLPPEYNEIKLTSEKIETLAPKKEKVVVVDTTKPFDYYEETVKRTDGSIWQSYKHYYKDGAEVKVEPLAKSTYTAWAGEVIVGPGYNLLPQIPVVNP